MHTFELAKVCPREKGGKGLGTVISIPIGYCGIMNRGTNDHWKTPPCLSQKIPAARAPPSAFHVGEARKKVLVMQKRLQFVTV